MMDVPEIYPGRDELRLIFAKMKVLGLWAEHIFGGYAATDEATQERSYSNFRAAVLYRLGIKDRLWIT